MGRRWTPEASVDGTSIGAIFSPSPPRVDGAGMQTKAVKDADIIAVGLHVHRDYPNTRRVIAVVTARHPKPHEPPYELHLERATATDVVPVAIARRRRGLFVLLPSRLWVPHPVALLRPFEKKDRLEVGANLRRGNGEKPMNRAGTSDVAERIGAAATSRGFKDHDTMIDPTDPGRVRPAMGSRHPWVSDIRHRVRASEDRRLLANDAPSERRAAVYTTVSQ